MPSSFVASATRLFFAGGAAALLFPTMAQASTTSVTHSFSVSVSPTGLYNIKTDLNGKTTATGAANDAYLNNGSWLKTLPFPLETPVGTKSALSSGPCAVAAANSDANFFGGASSITGSIVATATVATTALCPGIQQIAQANATAKINISQFAGFKNGQIKWKPIFNSGVNVCDREVRDPVNVDFIDTSGASLLAPGEGRLLSISTFLNDVDRCRKGITAQQFVDWSTNALTARMQDGVFEINADNPYLTNPGLLRVVAKDGLVLEQIATGRYLPVAKLLPAVGAPSDFTLPFSTDFPEEITLDYDYTPRVTDPNATLSIDLDGGVDVTVPGPLPVLGIGIAFGTSRRLRQRIKNHKSKT
jgi:hypothetical protein